MPTIKGVTIKGVPYGVELKLYKITYNKQGCGDVYILATDIITAEEVAGKQLNNEKFMGYEKGLTVKTIEQLAPQDGAKLYIQKERED